jgi:hypothetical protein
VIRQETFEDPAIHINKTSAFRNHRMKNSLESFPETVRQRNKGTRYNFTDLTNPFSAPPDFFRF